MNTISYVTDEKYPKTRIFSIIITYYWPKLFIYYFKWDKRDFIKNQPLYTNNKFVKALKRLLYYVLVGIINQVQVSRQSQTKWKICSDNDRR